MGHILDRCDVLDVLEESEKVHRPLTVTLKGGGHFIDQVRTIETDGDGEWAVFRAHDRIRVNDIAFCGPAEPPESTYRGKH